MFGPPPHNVRHNLVTRVPRTFAYLDSEATQHVDGDVRVQRFRLAVVGIDRRTHGGDGWRAREHHAFTDPATLWRGVTAWAKPKERLVVVAHNLGYDLRVTDALRQLTALGWQLQAIRLDGGHAWAVWKRDGTSMTMCDSLSWLPYGLDRLAPMVDRRKCPLPAWDDSDAAWLQRCTTDVDILGDVWQRLMAWILDADLGNWRPTGAGQSWSAFRHRFMRHALLVHVDPDARAAERRSTYTGRCEAWRHGKIAGGPFSEWDYVSAYAVVGRDCAVPTRLRMCVHAPPLAEWHALRRRYAVLSDVIVTTDVPCVPTRTDDGIVWPVGRFRSTLWENELQVALDRGAHVTVERCWLYDREPALADFCGWVLDQLADDAADTDPIVRVALKHWSRSLIGRFGARWARWDPWGRASVDDVRVGDVLDGDTGERWRLLQLGDRLWRESEPRDAPDCLPSIMAWIVAECRCRLLRAAETAGTDDVVYLDTDAIWTTQAGTQRLRQAGIEGLRVKRTARSLRVLGPRQLVIDGRVQAAGVPRDAVLVGPDVVEGEAWRQLGTSLREGEADSVTITVRRQRLRATDRRRVHLPGGRTAPLSLDLDPDA